LLQAGRGELRVVPEARRPLDSHDPHQGLPPRGIGHADLGGEPKAAHLVPVRLELDQVTRSTENPPHLEAVLLDPELCRGLSAAQDKTVGLAAAGELVPTQVDPELSHKRRQAVFVRHQQKPGLRKPGRRGRSRPSLEPGPLADPLAPALVHDAPSPAGVKVDPRVQPGLSLRFSHRDGELKRGSAATRGSHLNEYSLRGQHVA
jgi:hypothetical protein